MKFVRIITVVCLLAISGCAGKQLSPQEIAKLKGGTTTVIVYGFCVPMDYLISTTLTRYTLTFKVNGKPIGKMKSCSYAKFRVPSGYWSMSFGRTDFYIPSITPKYPFRPGKTQYLYMAPGGNGTYDPVWVDKARADKDIAAIKNIGQMF
ncbi:MAG: hypothetical protein AAGB04_21185 [Pseudomonadota bacterium]